MKFILIAIILGLPIGWIVSRAISGAHENASARTTGSSGAISSSQQPTIVLSFDQMRSAARANQAFSPYRDTLGSLDLIHSLSPMQLIDVIRSGQIREDNELDAAFQALAQLDTATALKMSEEIVDTDTLDRIQSVIVNTCVKSDPEGLLIHLNTLPLSSGRLDFLKRTARAWAMYDPITAMNHLEELQELLDDDRSGIASEMLEYWGAQDFDAAERWILNDCPVHHREDLHQQLLSSRLRWGGEEAVNFILNRNDIASRRFLRGAFLSWVQHTPEAALDRIGAMENEPEILDAAESLGTAAVKGIIHGNHKSSILTLQEKLPEGVKRWQFLLGAVKGAIAARSQQQAVDIAREIVVEIPEGYEREQAMACIAEVWHATDPDKFADWLQKLDPSPSRDSALEKIVMLVGKTDRSKARDWVELITNKHIRERLLGQFID